MFLSSLERKVINALMDEKYPNGWLLETNDNDYEASHDANFQNGRHTKLLSCNTPRIEIVGSNHAAYIMDSEGWHRMGRLRDLANVLKATVQSAITDQAVRTALADSKVIDMLEDLQNGFGASSLVDTICKMTRIVHGESLRSPGNAIEFARAGSSVTTMVAGLDTDGVRESATARAARQNSTGGPATVAGGPN